MLRLRLLLGVLILIGVFSSASAQEVAPPLLVLRHDSIDAVSLETGEITQLVPPPNGAVALRNHTHKPSTLFSAEWLSPDGRYLLYRTVAADALARVQTGTYRENHALYVVDVQTGDSVEIVFPEHESQDIRIESVAWTGDGTQLGVTFYAGDRANADSRRPLLAVYARETWERTRVTALPAPAHATVRRLIPAGDTFVLVERGVQGPHITFMRLGADGEVAPLAAVDVSAVPDVNLYILAPFNPLQDGTAWAYGLNRQLTGELSAGVDLETGELKPFENGLFPAMVSALAPDTSLRLTAGYFDGDQIGLMVRDADDKHIDDLPIFQAYAFGISADNNGSTFALAPDGQTVAFVQNDALMLWHDGELNATGVDAEALVWAPPRYQTVYDLLYLLG